MTREEYNASVTRIDKQIKELEEAKLAGAAAYIAEHAQFKKGDKVVLTNNARTGAYACAETKVEAFIMKVYEYGGVILYNFWKVKKDGSQSSHELYHRHYDKIELREPAKPTT